MRVTGSFDGAFRVTNEYLFSRLDEACMKWRVWKTPLSPEVPVCLAEGDVQLPAIAPGETGTARFTLPEGFRQADMLELEAYNAAGDTVCTWTYPIRNAHAYFEAYQRTVSTMPTRYQLDEDSVMLEAGEVRATFSRTDGMLLSLTRNGQLIPLSRGPLPVGMKAEVSSSAVRMQGDTAVFTVKYTGGTDSIVWRMTPSGLLGMDALILNRRGAFYDKDVYNLGFTFSYPERAVKGMQWLGHGPYRVWKNRIRGHATAFGRKPTTTPLQVNITFRLSIRSSKAIMPEFIGLRCKIRMDLLCIFIVKQTGSSCIYSLLRNNGTVRAGDFLSSNILRATFPSCSTYLLLIRKA